MAEIKLRNGKLQRYEESGEKVRRHHTAQTSTEREALKFDNEKASVTTSDTVLVEIPLEMITDRSDNRFRMTGIEKLADEIKKHGLHQNVIVVPNREGDGYIISSGHRRLHAYQMLKEEYANQNPDADNPYAKIPAEVKKGLSEDQEADIYLKTNSFSRNTTLMEAIANIKPEEMDFDDPKFKEEYLTYMYGDNAYNRFVNGEIVDKMNINSLSLYVYRQIKDNFQDLECTEESVRKYLRIYLKCSDIVLDRFYNSQIGVKELVEIANSFSKDEQNLIYNSENPDATKKEILARHKRTAKKQKKNDPDSSLKHITKEINKFTKPILMLCSELDKIEISKSNEETVKKIQELKAAIDKYLTK